MSEAQDNTAWQGLFNSFLMILLTEIGDKTFLITAILAMRHSRLSVFTGAICSLAVTCFLAAEVGAILPSLIPTHWTPIGAAVLFIGFGLKMLSEAREMGDDGNGKMEDEMVEAKREIEVDDAKHEGGYKHEALPLDSAEEGDYGEAKMASRRCESFLETLEEGVRNLGNLFFGPVFVQTFVLAFISEMGDRSQIATIALGAAHNVWIVTLGTLLGHCICTSMAVFGGRLIADRISVKQVTMGGAILFLLFGILYVWEAYTTILTL